MGIDIDIAAEHRQTGGWERAEPLVSVYDVDPWRPPGSTERVREPVYSGRNRALYRALAFGDTAGSERRGTFRVLLDPVARPRGLPPDVAPETAAQHEREAGYGASWLLLSELLAYDWDQEVVDVAFRKLSDDGERAAEEARPGPPLFLTPVRSFVVAPLKRLVIAAVRLSGARVGIFDVGHRPSSGVRPVPPPLGPEWEPNGAPYPDEYGDPVQEYTSRTGRTYREAVGPFLTETVPRLQQVGDPEDVRIVFWFS